MARRCGVKLNRPELIRGKSWDRLALAMAHIVPDHRVAQN